MHTLLSGSDTTSTTFGAQKRKQKLNQHFYRNSYWTVIIVIYRY